MLPALLLMKVVWLIGVSVASPDSTGVVPLKVVGQVVIVMIYMTRASRLPADKSGLAAVDASVASPDSTGVVPLKVVWQVVIVMIYMTRASSLPADKSGLAAVGASVASPDPTGVVPLKVVWQVVIVIISMTKPQGCNTVESNPVVRITKNSPLKLTIELDGTVALPWRPKNLPLKLIIVV